MKRKYGINVLSLWSWSSGKNGVRGAIDMAFDAGFDGIQALPLRGWTYNRLYPYRDFVISQEDSFVNGAFWESFINSVKLVLKIEKVPTPRFEDWLFFGENKSIRNLGGATLKCVHDLKDTTGDVVEINPELSVSHSFYVGCANRGVKFCVDTRHLRRPNRRDETQKIELPNHLLNALPDDSIRLIHVNPVENEENLLLNRAECELKWYLQYLGALSKAPVILEIVPPVIQGFLKHKSPLKYFSRKETVKYLSGLREAISEYLE